jgi:hypothetical protein
MRMVSLLAHREHHKPTEPTAEVRQNVTMALTLEAPDGCNTISIRNRSEDAEGAAAIYTTGVL